MAELLAVNVASLLGNPIPLSRDVYQFVIDADAATNEKKIKQANERRERQRCAVLRWCNLESPPPL